MSTEPEPVTTQVADLPVAKAEKRESQGEQGAVAHDPTPQEASKQATGPLREDKIRIKEVTQQIADQLGEQEAGPWQTIHRSVKGIGIEMALALLQKAQTIEEAGGMMLPDGSRRRTFGGVYFWLVRQEASADQRRHIFQVTGGPKPQPTGTLNAPQREYPRKPEKQPQPVASLTWAERGPVLDEAEAERGAVRTMKVTLIGRPEKLVERGQCVAMMMQQAPKIPSLPAGLPLPPMEQVEATRYSVYIAIKQWRKVAETMKDPEDALIVEGFQMLDREHGTIAVFASNVTSKKLQSAARQPKS